MAQVAIFGVPGGPFTGTCSAAHVPSWSGETLAALKAAGVEQVLCVCVASPYAMNAWAEKLAAEGIGFYTCATPPSTRCTARSPKGQSAPLAPRPSPSPSILSGADTS
eukprot:3641629-Prymnesium_polylepis.1